MSVSPVAEKSVIDEEVVHAFQVRLQKEVKKYKEERIAAFQESIRTSLVPPCQETITVFYAQLDDEGDRYVADAMHTFYASHKVKKKKKKEHK